MSKKRVRIALFIVFDIISVFATLFISLGLRIGFNAITLDHERDLLITGIIMALITGIRL